VAGATIDHMISLTILIAALLIAMTTYNGMFATAVDYDRNRQVANKAVDLMNTICLSPGSPANWSQTDSSMLGFGLQNPETGGYTLSPYATMRLTPSDSQIFNYTKTEELLQFSNVSMGQGGFLGVPLTGCVNYTSASELLGVNGSYGFQINIMPTLSISISETTVNPLSLRVEVRGPGLALSGATLNYFLYHVETGGSEPSFESWSGNTTTNSAGLASLNFPFDGAGTAYSIIVYAQLSGLVGVGYYSHDTIGSDHIIPIIEDFAQGKILLAHSWDVHQFPNPHALHFNATFFGLSYNFELSQFIIDGETDGVLNYGESDHTFARLEVPPSETGILVVSYKHGNDYGIIMMPWGTNPMGVSVVFGGDPSGYRFVATELRQVTINGVSYQVKVSAWKLGN